MAAYSLPRDNRQLLIFARGADLVNFFQMVRFEKNDFITVYLAG